MTGARLSAWRRRQVLGLRGAITGLPALDLRAVEIHPLTIVALAIRQADHIASQMSARTL